MGGTRTVAGVDLRWGARTDVGRVRSVNEDSMLAEAPVFLVADGMGGHEAGDVASASAVTALAALVDVEPDDPAEVSRILGEANDGILAAGAAQPEDRSMGTTAVGLVLLTGSGGPVWMIFNIGDSRIYRLAGGRLSQLSTDHSYVQELVDAGRITPSAALTHPQRNVVTRALGVESELEVDLWLRAPAPGERFLLCSDGLSGELAHAAIEDVLGRQGDPEDHCALLVDRALAAGGKDNITAVIVEVVSVDGVGVEEYNTNPRDEVTREHRAVSGIAATSRRGVDVAGASDGTGTMIEMPNTIRPVHPTPPGVSGSDAARPLALDADPDGQLDDQDGAPSPATGLIDDVPLTADGAAQMHRGVGTPNSLAPEVGSESADGSSEHECGRGDEEDVLGGDST